VTYSDVSLSGISSLVIILRTHRVRNTNRQWVFYGNEST